MPPRPVSIANRHPRLRLDRRAVVRVIHTLDAHAHLFNPTPTRATGRKSKIQNPKSKIPSGPLPGELSIVFLTDPALARLHADFLADPTTTDVITFDGDAALGMAGEICVSADTAATYAKKNRRDFNAELMLYVVHGWLHLAGYDDRVPTMKREMRRAEARALKLLRDENFLPRFSFRKSRK